MTITETQDTGIRSVVESVVVNAPAEAAFDVVADVALWPQYFTPVAHAEQVERSDGADVVKVWNVAADEKVTVTTSARVLDRAGLRIIVENTVDDLLGTVSAPVRGAWTFDELANGSTVVEYREEVGGGTTADELGAAVSDALATVKDTAERRDELAQLVVSFADPLEISGAVGDAYQVLYEADKWPTLIAHVASIDMTEDIPNIQFFDMDTSTPDGSAHTTRSVRICFPDNKIIYKQISLPALLDAHTGHWLFTPTADGLVAEARHTATIKPSALPLLGENTTVADARTYLRNVLGTNSLKNLALAKDFAEGRKAA